MLFFFQTMSFHTFLALYLKYRFNIKVQSCWLISVVLKQNCIYSSLLKTVRNIVYVSCPVCGLYYLWFIVSVKCLGRKISVVELSVGWLTLKDCLWTFLKTLNYSLHCIKTSALYILEHVHNTIRHSTW